MYCLDCGSKFVRADKNVTIMGNTGLWEELESGSDEPRGQAEPEYEINVIVKMWSDGIARANHYRGEDEDRMIRAVVGRRLDQELNQLLAENRKLRAQLEKNKIAKAAGAK